MSILKEYCDGIIASGLFRKKDGLVKLARAAKIMEATLIYLSKDSYGGVMVVAQKALDEVEEILEDR